jgi:hypothetical protein
MDPVERLSYVMGIITILWILCFDTIVEYFVFGSFKSIIPNYAFVLMALFFMWLYKYVYVTKKRYERNIEISVHKYNITEKTGITISIIFVFLSFLIPMIVIVLLHKMDNSL